MHPPGLDYPGLRIAAALPNTATDRPPISVSSLDRAVVFALHFRSVIMRYGNDQPEAPTHLGSHQLPLPPEWLPAEELEDVDPPTHAAARGPSRPRLTSFDVSDSVPSRYRTERSVNPVDEDRPHPEDLRREARRRSRPRVEEPRSQPSVVVAGELATPDQARSSSDRRSSVRSDARPGPTSASVSASASAVPLAEPPSVNARGSQPALAAQGLAEAQAQAVAAAAAGLAAFDPMQIPVPPELAGPIYGWVRRLALQADLLGADRVLRDAFLDLTSSLSVAIVYPGADGLWTLGADDEIPQHAEPIVGVAQARRVVIASHTALIPVVTSSETVAVVLLTRNPRNPAYHPIEQVAMIALARECAAILHHLAVGHLQRASEIQADQGGLYRGEALEAHRARGNEGVPVNLSPGWVRRTYPVLVVTILVAALGSVFITVPTYSSGTAVVVLQGTPVMSPTTATVEAVLVKPNQHVVKGTILVRLHSGEQDAELASAQADADNATIQYLFDRQDEQIKKTLATALTRVDREKARVESRLVRASKDGTVSDLRVTVGAALQIGDHILTIVKPDAEPEMFAFLPGKDRPRLREGQTLQVELLGYTKTRELAKITYVANEVIGGPEISKLVGPHLAESLKLQGSFVFVKARLPAKAFKTEHRTYFYHHGMPAKVEVKVVEKPFLVTLLPALEKYLPD